MSDREEWGPWVDHDASPCPIAIGMWCEVTCRFASGREKTKQGRMNAKAKDCPSWVMKDEFGPWNKVIRYRVKKPRALIQLREMIENLPAPSRQKECAHD